MGKSSLRIGKRTLQLSNLDKVLYPAGRFTKAKVIEYYSKVSAVLLPHFKDRPVTLVRYPDGVFAESFYEKNAPRFTPEWVKTFAVPRSEGGAINYILINDLLHAHLGRKSRRTRTPSLSPSSAWHQPSYPRRLRP